MGRRPCCSKVELKKGHWTSQEDKILVDYVRVHGEGKWRDLAQKTGLKRCGKSCRLRWLNYLRPGIKLGNISEDEEDLIIKLHRLLGNRWTLIAGRLPGRSGNEIKNYWNTTLSKRVFAEKNKHSRLDTDLEEKKAEHGPQPAAAMTTGSPSMQPNGPNPTTESTKTGCNPPHDRQRTDQVELIHDNETSFREYIEASISPLPVREMNDDLLSFWMDSEIELCSTDALVEKAQDQQHISVVGEALGEYDFSFDIFS